jgi:hypothetical protein
MEALLVRLSILPLGFRNLGWFGDGHVLVRCHLKKSKRLD